MSNASSGASAMKLTTVDENLQFRSLSAIEELGRLFEFSVLAVVEDAEVVPADLLGTKATVTIELNHDGPRHFNGLITRSLWGWSPPWASWSAGGCS